MKKLLRITLLFATISLVAQEKQNVLFILVDDLKPLIHAYGEDQMITPNFDAFAEQSVVFTNAHTQQAVCAPSRVSFMTGMRPDYTQVLDLKTHMRDKDPNALTIAEHFKNNGYETVGMGKVLHGAKNNDPRSWSIPFINDDMLSYSKTPADLQYQNAKTHRVYDSLVKAGTKKGKIKGLLKKAGARPSVEMVDVPDDAYVDGATAKRSIAMMQQFQKTNTPFFITLGFRKPHLPFTPPKKYWDLYKRDEIKLAEFQERVPNTPRYSYHNFGELKAYSDIPAHVKNDVVDNEKQRELIHGYYASVSFVDAQLGKVLNFLKSSGLDKNTTVVLIGDHGWHLGDHGLWNKHSNFEQATRTPFYVMSPNTLKGVQNGSPVELVDAFPTICELTGVKAPNNLQGKSLVPIVTGKANKVKDVAISQYPRYGGRMGYAVRNERYRYVEWRTGDYKKSKDYIRGEVQAQELYDYETDPLETKNLADDPAYAQIIAELQNSLNEVILN